MARVVKKAVKRISARADKAKARISKAARQTKAIAERTKSKLIHGNRGKSQIVKKATSSVKKIKRKMSRKLRKPAAKDLLASDLRKLGGDLLVLQKDMVKFGRSTFRNEIESIRRAGRDLIQAAKKQV